MPIIPLVIAVLLQVPQPSQPPSPAPPSEAKKQQNKSSANSTPSNTKDYNADPVSSAIDKLTAEIRGWKEQNGGNAKKGQSFGDWWLRWGNLICVAISAFAAIVTMTLIAVQARVMHKQRLAMEQQTQHMRAALTETTKAADAAIKSADTAEKTLHISQRADILVREIYASNTYVDDGTMFTITLQNYGNTRATEVSPRFYMESLDYSLTAPGPGKLVGYVSGPETVRGPRDEWEIKTPTAGHFIAAQEWGMIHSGTRRLWLHVVVSYKDVFGEARMTIAYGIQSDRESHRFNIITKLTE